MMWKKIFIIVVAGLMLTTAFAGTLSIAADDRGTVDNSDSEPNDDLTDATNITSNSVTIPGTLNGGDMADTYKIWLDNNGATADTVAILADFNTSTGVSIEIRDERDFEYYYGFDANADNVQLKFIATVPQHFFINLSTQIGDANYQLTITKTNGPYTGNGNNDPTQAPTAAGDNNPLTQNLDGDTPTDMQDFYKIDLTSSGSASDLLVAFLDQPNGAIFWLEIYQDGGGGTYLQRKMVKGAQPGDNMTLTWGTSQTGTYYLRVLAWSGSGSYTIYIQKTSINKDTDNSYDAATAITLTGDHTWNVNGEVGESIDSEDWFKMPIVLGQFINGSISSLDYNSNTKLPQMYLSLYASNHVTEYWDPNETDSKVDPNGYTNGTSTEASGNNFLQVYVIGGGGGGKYSIDLLTDKPPKVTGTPGPISVVENTVDTSLKLNTLFSDPDTSDQLVYTLKKGQGGTEGFDDNTNLSLSIGGDSTVTITPKADDPNGWTGSGPVTFTATDPYGLNASAEIIVSVKGTNHKPYVLAPYDTNLSFTEPLLLTYGEKETNTTIDLKKVFADNDTGDKLKFDLNTDDPLWIEKDTSTVLGETILDGATINNSIRIGFTKESNLIDHKGPISVRITDGAKNDMLDHDATIYFHAIDNGDPILNSPQVKLVVKIRSPGGNAPEWKRSFTKVQFDEDSKSTVDMDENIIDIDPIDDGALEYSVSGLGTNISVNQVDRNNFEFMASPDWNGEVMNVTVTATDTFGLVDETTIKVIVNPVADAPVEDPSGTSPSPMGTVVVDEGSYRMISLGVYDPDGEDVVPIFEWYLDGDLMPTEVLDHYNYTPSYDDAGSHTIKVIVKDDSEPGLQFNITWNIEVNDVNRDPTNVKIVEPENNSTFKQGSKVGFKAQSAKDPDGDTLVYSWFIDGNPTAINNNQTFDFKLKGYKHGVHEVTLKVTDGKGGKTTDKIVINIKKKKQESPGFEASLLLLAMLAVGLISLKKRG